MDDSWEMDQNFWNDAYKDDPDNVVVADFFLDEEIDGLPKGSALDLGCGSGPNALKLAERGWSVVGVDWSERAIELATKAARDRGLDATFYVADTTNWDPPAQFDLVISTYALPGGDDSRKVLHTAVRALAPGGTLLVVEWDKSMSEIWPFAEDDLLSPEQIVDYLPELVIENSEVRHQKDVFPADDPRGQFGTSANVAFVRARKS